MRIIKPLPGILTEPEPNMIACWPMNSLGDEIFDRSGNRNNAAFGAGAAKPVWQPGKTGHCIGFDGGDHISGPSLGALSLPLTIVASIKLSALGVSNPIFASHDVDNLYYGVAIRVSPTNQVWLQYGDGTGNISANRNTKVGTSTLSANRYYHLACVIRGQNDMDIYIEGVDDGGTYSGTAITMATNSGIPDFGRWLALATDVYLTGNIEYVYFLNRALSHSEIARLYPEPFYNFPESRVFAAA